MQSQDSFRSVRFLMRSLEASDAPEIVDCINDFEMARNLARVPHPYTLKDAKSWIKYTAKARARGNEYAFLITVPDQGVIGSVGFNHSVADAWEIGYWVRQEWWARGVATEAASALIEWGRGALSAEKFIAGHFADNPASGRVLTKLGFRLVGENEMSGLARGEKGRALRYAYKGTPAELALQAASH